MTKGNPGCTSGRRNMILDRKTEMLKGMISIDIVGQLLKNIHIDLQNYYNG